MTDIIDPKDFDLAVSAVKSALDDQKKAFETFKEKNDGHLKEMKSGFDDVVRKEELDRINSDLDEKQKHLDAAMARMKRIERFGMDGEKGDSLEKKAAKFGAFLAKNGKNGNLAANFDIEAYGEYKNAFEAFLRDGGQNGDGLEPEQRKALSVGSDPDGGYIVHPDMSGRMVGRIFETSPMRQYASVQTISTDALEGLFNVDKAASGWVQETGTRSVTDTPQIGAWRIPVHEQYALPQATQKLLDDAELDAEAWLANEVADQLAREENTAFVTGNGVGKPRGFLDYSTDWTTAGTFEQGKIEQFDTGANGDFVADPNGGDVLLSALYGLISQYRMNATWFMNRGTTGRVRQLQDSNGAYIWSPGIAAGQPSTLLGYPVANFEDMTDYTTTGALAIAVGDMREAYQIVDRAGTRVLRDPYSNKPYVQFYTVKRVGGDVVNFEALKFVRFSA